MNDNRWQFKWVDCDCVDARFLYNLSRTFDTFNDKRSNAPVPNDPKDAEVWKEHFATIGPRPLLAFALAIDFNQEPAQRAMEANRWKLVATGLRGHDRVINGQNVYARLYMRKFLKTGTVFPAKSNSSLSASYSCSFDVSDNEWTAGNPLPLRFHTCYAPGTMILHRVPVVKLEFLQKPTSNFECIAKTDYAHYFLSNAVEIFERAK